MKRARLEYEEALFEEARAHLGTEGVSETVRVAFERVVKGWAELEEMRREGLEDVDWMDPDIAEAVRRGERSGVLKEGRVDYDEALFEQVRVRFRTKGVSQTVQRAFGEILRLRREATPRLIERLRTGEGFDPPEVMAEYERKEREKLLQFAGPLDPGQALAGTERDPAGRNPRPNDASG